MFKNVAGQKVVLYAFDSVSGVPITGDAANITAYVSIDGGAVTVLADTSATEMSATNAKGDYQFSLSQAETNGDNLRFSGKSSSPNIVVLPKEYCTAPANFTTLSIDGDGDVELASQHGLTLIAQKAQTSLRFLIAGISSQDIYFVIWLSDGSKVYDFDDHTFKTLGSATTPYVAASEVTNPAGTGHSWYTATADMTLIASGLAPQDIAVEAFVRAGGSPALTTDSSLAAPVAKRIRFGMADPAIGGRVTPVYKRELDTWDADFTVTADGTPVSFEGTGVLSVRGSSGALLFTALSSSTITDAVDSIKHLRFTKLTPGFTGDRDYSARVVLTDGSTTFTVQDTFQVLA